LARLFRSLLLRCRGCGSVAVNSTVAFKHPHELDHTIQMSYKSEMKLGILRKRFTRNSQRLQTVDKRVLWNNY